MSTFLEDFGEAIRSIGTSFKNAFERVFSFTGFKNVGEKLSQGFDELKNDIKNSKLGQWVASLDKPSSTPNSFSGLMDEGIRQVDNIQKFGTQLLTGKLFQPQVENPVHEIAPAVLEHKADAVGVQFSPKIFK